MKWGGYRPVDSREIVVALCGLLAIAGVVYSVYCVFMPR